MTGLEKEQRRIWLRSALLVLDNAGMLAVPPLQAQEHPYGSPDRLAPFVPTPMEVVEAMLKLADVKEGDVVYDLGCGDGRIVVMAAEKFGATGVGVDYDTVRVAEANALVKEKQVEDKVTIVHQNALTVDLSPASVVTLYLLESANERLRPNLEKYLKPGSRVISHDFNMPGWQAKKVITVPESDSGYGDHKLYLWVIGEQLPKKN